jgi:DNA-directed RNA polymerase
MLRCKIGGKATNLMNKNDPQDIYQDVADCVLRNVRRDMEDGDEMAEKWLNSGLINRKMTKRPVMVVPYGGTRFSCRSYVEEYVRDAIYDGADWPWDKNLPLYIPVNWITGKVWNAITEVVVSAREAMNWIRKVSSIMSKEDYPLIWWVPSGMIVHQQYKDVSKKKIFTHIDGILIKPTVQVEDDSGIDNRRAVNGSAPNFVHSLDACALTFTVNMCVEEGVKSFQMIHDSYGTHAHNTPKLAGLLRKAFVKLYQEFDPLEEFRQAALEVVDQVPNPPKRGELDITEVLDSKYFFC